MVRYDDQDSPQSTLSEEPDVSEGCGWFFASQARPLTRDSSSSELYAGTGGGSRGSPLSNPDHWGNGLGFGSEITIGHTLETQMGSAPKMGGLRMSLGARYIAKMAHRNSTRCSSISFSC